MEEQIINAPKNIKSVDASLDNPEFLRLLQETLEYVKEYGYVREAGDLAMKLELLLQSVPNFQLEKPDMNKQYREIITKLKFVALPVLQDQQKVLDLISRYPFLGFEMPRYNFKAAFDGFLLSLYSEEAMGDFLIKMEKLFEENDTRLGELPLETSTGTVKPTIGNWIKEYIRVNIGKGERGSFDQVSFINKNQNVAKLPREQKELLKKILDFYDWLVYPKDSNPDFMTPEIERQFRWVSEHATEVVNDVLKAQGRTDFVKAEEIGSVPAKVPVAPRPPLPSLKATEGTAKVTDELKMRTQSSPPAPLPTGEGRKGRGLPAPPSPPTPSPYPSRPSTTARDTLPSKGEGNKEVSNEDLYRKTLEELRKLRAQEVREGTGEPPSAINEQLIQADQKGKLLGGGMGTGKEEKHDQIPNQPLNPQT
ncbi:MAG: hypothetical protein Q8R08_04590 [bacterium]|nr:hypothetical protein [bacterium]